MNSSEVKLILGNARGYHNNGYRCESYSHEEIIQLCEAYLEALEIVDKSAAILYVEGISFPLLKKFLKKQEGER